MTEPNKISKLYNGKIEIGFWENRHRYSLKESSGAWSKKFIISVTGATSMVDKSRVLMAWQEKLTREYLEGFIGKKLTEDIVKDSTSLHRKRKDEAADSGTQVHDWVETYIKAKLARKPLPEMPKDEKILNGAIAFVDWVKDNKVKFLASEKMVYSKKYKYVGLLDIKAEVNGELTLCDIKTSKGIYPEMYMQVSAYRQADEEESGDKYDNMMILKLDKNTGDFEAHPFNEYKKHFEAFKNCLGLKQWQKMVK